MKAKSDKIKIKNKESVMDFSKSRPIIEKKIGYTFKDKSLLKQAFTRASYCNEQNHGKINLQSNEVLEFFGDSVLSLSIVTLLMKSKSQRYENGLKTEWNEGDFSNIKSRLSDKKNLSLATERLGLEKYLIMGEGDAKLGIENEPSVKEDLFESIIGAIYVDSEYNVGTVMAVVENLLSIKEYQKNDTPPIQSFKNALQEWCASKLHKRQAPIYKTLSEDGPDHKKNYKRGCYIGEKLYGVGEGKNQKIADSEAAKMALDALRDEAEKEAKKQGVALATPAAKLREYAICHKMSSPSYKDLGESENSTVAKRIFVVECSFSKFCERGYGETKATAKSDAVSKVLEKLRLETKSAKKSAKNSTNQKSVQDKAPVQRKKTKAKKAPAATKK